MANLKIIITVALISLVVVVVEIESRPNKRNLLQADTALKDEIEKNKFVHLIENSNKILDNVEDVYARKRRSDGEGGEGGKGGEGGEGGKGGEGGEGGKGGEGGNGGEGGDGKGGIGGMTKNFQQVYVDSARSSMSELNTASNDMKNRLQNRMQTMFEPFKSFFG